MMKLTHEQAVRVLEEVGAEVSSLARAVATLADDPASSPEELLPALDHPGFVAEQAAIALHRMTGVPWPQERQPNTSRRFWQAWLQL